MSTGVHKLQHNGEVILNHYLRQFGREGSTPEELVGILARKAVVPVVVWDSSCNVLRATTGVGGG